MLNVVAPKNTDPEIAERKQHLINTIIGDPSAFTGKDFNELMSKEIDLDFADLRRLITRIFDINESTLRQQSDATTGLMGIMNRKSTAKRQKKYYKLIESGFRDKAFINNKVIVAEGDSWFQFPFLINDIIDWLKREPHYAVYSIAYGGDWFTNILYEEKYIEELSIHRPDVFLISGGGNDFVGSSRLAIMVQETPRNYDLPTAGLRKHLLQFERTDIRADIESGYQHITDSFFSFIWTIKAQYYKLFSNLKRSGKYDHMRIITQGYDYVLPTLNKRHKKFLQGFINSAIGSGKWLMRPMMIKGVTDEKLAAKIMKAMIYEINCMFTELAIDPDFPNVYHIDCRNTASGWNDWYDELHLHSNKYREIANAYKRCIEGDGKQKIVRVNELGVPLDIDEKILKMQKP